MAALQIMIALSVSIFTTGQEIPRFQVQPSDTNVVESDVASIACSATGIPASTVVSWLKNGQPIIFGGGKSIVAPGNLRISYVSRSDDGYYQCVARNSIASVISRRAKLNVAYFDQVFSLLQYRTKNARTSFIEVSPSVTINQLPKPVYTWKKNGVKLVEDGRIGISVDHALYIADLKTSDAGRYTCEVENPVMKTAGKINAKQTIGQFQLTVSDAVPLYDGVALMRSLQNTKAYLGMDPTVHLECFPNRSNTAIIWTKNGVILRPSTKYRFDSSRKRLTIVDPQTIDQAQYSCESSYLTHKVSGSGQLLVIVPPAFLTKEMTTNAFSGNSTFIWCNATILAQLKWYHNGKQILASTSRVIIFPNGTLFVKQLSWRDSGVYQCVVANKAGQAMALTRLNVLNITARILTPLRDIYFPVGSTAVVPCYVEGAPKPTIRWLRNGLAIPPSERRFSTTSQGYLQIINSVKADSGRFTCIANNGGADAMSAAYVGIVDPTVVTKGPNATTMVQKAVTILLPCKVSHDPTVNVTWEWRKNTARLSDSRYTVLADGTLQIVSPQEADTATFSCHVFSNGGNATVSTVLKIVSLPLSPSTPTASDIRTNSLRLTWLAPEYNGGIPLKDYELQIKNKTSNVFRLLMFSTRSSIEVKRLLAGVEYSFRVAARNELGRGRWSAATRFILMKVEAPSRPPSNLHIVSTKKTSITLRWTPPPLEFHNGRLRGYNIYYRVQGYTNSAFTIRVAPPGLITETFITYELGNLLTFTVYEIKVAAFNDAGVGVRTALITGETKPGIPSVAPRKVSIDVVNSTAASVSYLAPNQVFWNGQLIASRGYAYESESPLDPYTYDASYNHATRYNQTFIMRGLKPNTPYALRVAVVTASGAGPKSAPVYFRMQEGSPGSPRNFMVSETFAHSILLRWSPPNERNGILLGYKVGHRVYQWGGGRWIPRKDPEPAESGGAVFRNLLLNTRYEFYVLAYTSAGDGPRVLVDAQTRKTAPTLPGKPSKPILVENNGTSITLSWVIRETGGTLMSYYLIEANNQTNYNNLPEAYRDWYLVVNLTRIQDIPTRIKNLTTNTVYRFRVTPVNSVGRGPTSNVSQDILTAESRPAVAPTNLRATAYERQSLLIQWVPPPKYTWGSSTIFYKIKLVSIGKRDRDERIVHQRDSQSRQYIAVGLAKWTWFNVTVTVYNSVGNGPTSWPVTARTAEDVPDNGPATIKVSVVSSSVANVTWTPVPPELRNGVILGYFVYYNIKTEKLVVHRKTIIGGNTLATVLTGLAGYARYEVRIAAYTKSGEGKKTDPEEFVTPDGIAGAPYRVRFPVVRTDFVRVTWLPPLRPNGAIVSYEVRHKVQGTSDDFAVVNQPRNGPDIRSADVDGLIGNRYYVFRVYAKTRLGRGVPAEELVFTSPNRQVPESPVMLPIPLSDVDSTSVLVKWKPRYDGMSPIRSYTLQYNKQPDGWKDYLSNVTGRVDIDANVTSLLVTRLLPSSSYSFRIKATNDVGDSAWSASSNMILTHPDAPKGAPRNLRIRPLSPTSLRIEWEAPTFEDLGGLPVQFLLRYREYGISQWSASRQLPKAPLFAVITNLKGYTAYEVSMAAKNDRGSGPWAQKTGITGESKPTHAPTNIILTTEDSTTIKVRWTAPPLSTIRGNLLGYKIEYIKLGVVAKRRRRRATKSICPTPQDALKTKIAGPYMQEETIRNAGKYSRYSVTVRAYNGADDGPRSEIKYINTPEGTPSAPVILWSRPYINDIDIQWRWPCSPNGKITAYEVQYWEDGKTDVKKRQFNNQRSTDRISGLKPLTLYRIQLKAATRSGFGDPAMFTLKTGTGVPVLPGKPGKPEISALTSTTAKLRWKEGDIGYAPIKKYNIQFAKSDGNWKTGWEVHFDRWGREGNVILYTVTNLQPETQYSFRVIAVNKMGASLSSDSTATFKTGKKVDKPFHSELWFILLIVMIGLLIAALLVLFICIRRRNKQKTQYNSHLTVKEQRLKQQAIDLKSLQSRPHSEFISAYGYEEGKEALTVSMKKDSERPNSELFLPKEIEEKLQSGHTGTMKDRKNRLEKLDLQPMAFEVPKVPDDVTKKGERRAPEGEEEKRNSRGGMGLVGKKSNKGSYDDSQCSESEDCKNPSSVEYLSESGEEWNETAEANYPTVIRRHPRPANARTQDSRLSEPYFPIEPPSNETLEDEIQFKSFVNSDNEMASSKVERGSKELNGSLSPKKLELSTLHHVTPKPMSKNERKTEDSNVNKQLPRTNDSFLDEIIARKRSLHRPPSSNGEDYKMSREYRSENDVSDVSNREKDSREMRDKYNAQLVKSRSRSSTSLKKFSSDFDDDVFVNQRELSRIGKRSLESLSGHDEQNVRHSDGTLYGRRYNENGYAETQLSDARPDRRPDHRSSANGGDEKFSRRSLRESREWSGKRSDERLDRMSDRRFLDRSGYKSDVWSDGRSNRISDEKSGNRSDIKSGGRPGRRSDERLDRMSDRRSHDRSGYKSDVWSDGRSNRISDEKSGYRSDIKSGGRPGRRSDARAKSADRSGLRSGGESGSRDTRRSSRKSDRFAGETSDIWSDDKSDRVSYRSRPDDSDYDDEWEVNVDDYSRTRMRSRNDEDDYDYQQLVKGLTRGRAPTPRENHLGKRNREERARSTSRRDQVNRNGNNGALSSFELAMVKNKGGSAQRLVNSDTESRSTIASKKSKITVDRKSTKDPLEDRTASSISKHSEPSDNDADKSDLESEEEGKLLRGAAAGASIASHYANDPFYKNWRNSLDKKTRKAILTEYHDKNKKGAAAANASVESFGSSKPYRSASEEGLDRIAHRRPRPGKTDLSEKRKLAQSDPYLNQEPAPSISSFSPSAEGERPVVGRPSQRPGKRPINRAAARSEPSLNVNDSDSDGENRFPPPYEDENARRRKNSFLRATKGSRQSLRKGSIDNLDEASRAKKDLAAELDKAANYYTNAPPPYEDEDNYDVDIRSPPAYTPHQESSDESRPGYNRMKRNWRPQRQQSQNGDRRDYGSQSQYDARSGDDIDDDDDDYMDGPSRTSMTLV